MLTIQSITSPREQRALFDAFDPTQATWIVSDLKSKLDLQKRLLSKRDFLDGESILRASELWRALLLRLRPDLQIVSREFILTWLSHKLSRLEFEWAKAPGAAQAAYDYLTQLMPVFSHPEGGEMMREWFSENNAAEARWGKWFELGERLWRDLLAEGFVAPTWASGVLVNEPDLAEVWTRPLVVDLGAELDQVEADLFALLSNRLEIRVLRPEPAWARDYGRALAAYEIFERKLKVGQRASEPLALEPSRPAIFRKYTTMIAEVKDATAQVRAWLESGVARPCEIAIVAPDIEAYWPALSSYLDHEGVPTQKDRVRRTQVFADVARWLAALRLRMGEFAEADVELSVFDAQVGATRTMTYDRFKVLYTTIYGREDLERSAHVAKLFALQLKADDEAGRDEFVAWSLKQLPEGAELDRIETVFQRLFAECPRSLRLTSRRWLSYLERLTAKVEVRVADGDPDGISCINLGSAVNSPATHMIVLGLTESALKTSTGTSLLASDAASLASQFGFHLASEDQSSSEFEARWLIEDATRERLLTVAETDFAGAAQAASWLWVRGARERATHDRISVPSETRWDETQRAASGLSLQAIGRERGWRAAHGESLERSLAEDLGHLPARDFARHEIERLSPSAIEDYLECPFIFASKYLFGLTDVSELDLEVDPARRGSLMHKVFELLTVEPVRFDYSKEELDALVEKARESSRLELADARLWAPLKARHIDLAERFLAHERELRARFPRMKTLAREADIAGYIELETGELHRDPPASPAIRFVGRIDRVDADDQGHMAIFDYKSSQASAAQHGSWLKNNQIQLLLYAMAVENGLTSLEAKPVVAALYYVARPFNRDYGFKVEGLEQGLYEIEGRKKNRISPEEKDRLFSEGKSRLREAVQGILAGRFAPQPRDRNGCPDCRWSPLCRAPHLNN